MSTQLPSDASLRKEVEKPTPEQADAGNYRKAHVTVQGLDVTIENPRGSVRSGTSKAGKSWSVTMKHHYGYIKRTEGKDGDHVDVFIGPHPDTFMIFVVDQGFNGKFDEHKVMLGFKSKDEAKQGYLDNYEKNWQGLQNITSVSQTMFKQWLKDGDQTKPFSSWKIAAVLKKTAEVAVSDTDYVKAEVAKMRAKYPDSRVGKIDPADIVSATLESREQFDKGHGHWFCASCDKGHHTFGCRCNCKNRINVKNLCSACRGTTKEASADYKPWTGVDLDGTLAKYDGYKGPTHIGDPVPKMLGRVKAMIANGKEVRIFTARADDSKAVKAIRAWSRKHIGKQLPVTNVKDHECERIYDDRARQVEKNTGNLAKLAGMVKTMPFKVLGPADEVKGQLQAEIADTGGARAKGMAKHSSVPNTGMFFDVPGPFWMKGMTFPLDVAFLNKKGEVLEIQHMPVSNAPDFLKARYASSSPEATYALEMPAGWFGKHGVVGGDLIEVAVEDMQKRGG